MMTAWRNLWCVPLALGAAACSVPSGSSDTDTDSDTEIVEGTCEIPAGEEAPEFVQRLGCTPDFEALSSLPLDTTLPGARSVKVVLDLADTDALYFQNSTLYKVHYDFISTHLSGGDLPIVPQLDSFNTTEYYSPSRRFLLGAVTYYDGPKEWTLELAPYDTATAEMIVQLFSAVQGAAFFGPALAFHPTSEALSKVASGLPSGIRTVTTQELYAATDYQPLTLGSTVGRLRFLNAVDLSDEYVSFEDVLVLDQAPNDLSVVRGLITQEFQTPLSHVNVLSQNRHTPNMGLRDAMSHAELRSLEGQLVRLEVGASQWTVRGATQAEADAYWDEHKPDSLSLPALDLSVTDIVDIEEVTLDGEDLRDSIKTAIGAFGGKAAHYSILAKTDGVPVRPAFAIPVYYYDAFMRDGGFYDRIEALLADEEFSADYAVRDAALAALRDDMMSAPLDEKLEALLTAKLDADYPGLTMRFRTSTNSEDLDGFPCAGCYESHTGDPADFEDVRDAIRETYASAWLFRTFEERSYYGIDHKALGMALLVHHNFPDEEANGVAVTSNPFDASGLDPAFYVNVQSGGTEVVAPPAGVTSDQMLYYFASPNQPVTYLAHSNLIDEAQTVLTSRQLYDLGSALSAIHERFGEAYGPAAGNTLWYAMDIEFKYDDEDAAPGEAPALVVKQARPYPGRGE